jgi:hypothetical protein
MATQMNECVAIPDESNSNVGVLDEAFRETNRHTGPSSLSFRAMWVPECRVVRFDILGQVQRTVFVHKGTRVPNDDLWFGQESNLLVRPE